MKQYKFVINGHQYEVEIKDFNNNIADLEVNGTPFKVEVENQVTFTKTPNIGRPQSKAPAPPVAPSISAATSPVISPLPGTILQITVKVGDKVQKGDKLLIMEAMKMENNIQADRDGEIKSIKVAIGDNVLQGAVLVEIG
jgi:glutaconyl-CoA/methylmalonyl-CoA decarboxylase subunit gamma